ncbi:DUF4286 family protein [Flavobacteriaceae bacterium]|nr:DUF4286 family protein [Flavobacteriaceae bacterium]
MYIYNLTAQVIPELEQQWLEWVHKIHIPEMLGHAALKKVQLLRIQAVQDSGQTYALQYHSPEKASYETFWKSHEAILMENFQKHFGAGVLTFATHLELIANQQ